MGTLPTHSSVEAAEYFFAMSTLRISHFSSCSRYHCNHLSHVMPAGRGTPLVCRSNKPICLEGFSLVTRISRCWPLTHCSSFWPSHSPSFGMALPLPLLIQLQGFNYKVITATWLQQPHMKELSAAITDSWDGKLGENVTRQTRFYTSAF